MTLMLSVAAGTMVLHVGDRLLTADGAAWDPLANKSVVVLGSDGWACVSYSGLAYVDSKPTDQWLAEVLSERQAGPLTPRGGRAMMFEVGFVLRIGPALARLRNAIESDFARQPLEHRSHGMYVEVTGFIVRRRRKPCPRGRPFMHRYSHQGLDNSRLTRDALPRYWDWSRQTRLGSVGAAAGEAKRAALSGLGSAANQDECEQLLVDCIRSVSASTTTVGADCMSIVLSRAGDVRVRFLPDPANDSGQVAFTPWIVAPGIVAPPLVLEGRMPELQAGGFRVELDRIPPLLPSRMLAAAGSQRRRLFP